MRIGFTFILFLFVLFCPDRVLSQVEIFGLDDIESKKIKISDLKYASLSRDIDKIYFNLLNSGYLAVSVDSVQKNDSLKKGMVYFTLGKKYCISDIQLDSLSRSALIESGKLGVFGYRKNFNLNTYSRVVELIISHYENNGYPFAKVRLLNANWNNDTLNGVISTTLADRVSYGKVILKGDLDMESRLLSLITGIEEGILYSQENIDKLDKLLKSYPFIKMVRSSEYEFINNECNVYLYLDKKNANFFNAILGVLPNDQGKINITGDAKIKLINVLNKGEQFLINWRKLLPLTQNLNLEANFPFVLQMPVGFGGKFDLYKKDTSYLDIVSKAEVKYKLGQNLTFSGFYRNRSSSLLSTEKYKYVTVLPDFADIRNNEYGLSVQWQNLDFLYNPSKGWLTEFEGAVGDKKINKNSALNEELYNNLKLRSTQFYLKGTIDRYFKLYKKNVLKVGGTGGWVLNNNLFLNELFRLGGLNTLRGFDEESLFASGFALGTLEYRYLLEEYSNLFVFGQAMFYEQFVNTSYQQDIPYSFGAGINFQTKPGIFSISYSLGSQQNNPLLFRAAKIHFGFVNYF